MTTNAPHVDRFTVKFHECAPTGGIHCHAALKYLQDMAIAHAHILGCGADVMSASGLYWVLSNIKIVFHRFPAYADAFFIETWPSLKGRLIAQREFTAARPDGEKLLEAGSEWLVMNTKTRRPVKLTATNLNIPESTHRVLRENIGRLRPLTSGKPVHRFPVSFTCLDANGHVNNVEYLRWALDAMHLAMPRVPRIRSLQITYLSEVFEKDHVELFIDQDPGNRGCRMMGRNLSNEKPAFSSYVSFL